MKNKVTLLLTVLTVFGLLILAQDSVSAQGRGRGNSGSGGGNGRGAGNPNAERGIGNASSRSDGRSDRGLETANERSNGRSENGLSRAEMARQNGRRAEREVRSNPRAAAMLNTNANDLRDGYQAALANNPDLKFGQFVAANMLERNLGSRYPNVTSGAILDGLASGNSIGSTLRNLGVSSEEAKEAASQAKKALKARKNRN